MNPERLTPNDIKTLALSDGPAITLVLAANENGDQRIHLKGQLESLHDQAHSAGLDVKVLLDSIELPAGNRPGPVAILRSASISMTIPVDGSVVPIAKAADHFDLRTLLAIANFHKTFYLVALSLNRARILECTEAGSSELSYPAGFPSSLDDFLQTKKPDHDLENRHSAGPSVGAMKGVLSGSSSDKDKHDEYRLHYFSSVDHAVHAALKGQTAPLIPVGVESELALYGKVNTYPHLVAPGVHGSADALDGREVHARALELLESDPNDPRRKFLADYEKRVGTGHASAHVQEIITAAHEGRVSHLFMQQNAHYDGTFDEARQKIKHHTDSLDTTVDLIDEAGIQTLSHGGEVMLVPGRLMPNGVPVCALFRYASTEAPVSDSEVALSNSSGS